MNANKPMSPIEIRYYSAKAAEVYFETLLSLHYGASAGEARYLTTYEHPELTTASALYKKACDDMRNTAFEKMAEARQKQIARIVIEGPSVQTLDVKQAISIFGGAAELCEALQGHHLDAVFAYDQRGQMLETDNSATLIEAIESASRTPLSSTPIALDSLVLDDMPAEQTDLAPSINR